MHTKTILLISVFILLISCSPIETEEIEQQKGNISIDDRHKECNSDSDCSIVSIVCGDCGIDVVNKIHLEIYNTELESVCKDIFPKIVCDLDYREQSEIKCVKKICKFVPKK
jgi:hypothetical protein